MLEDAEAGSYVGLHPSFVRAKETPHEWGVPGLS